MKKIEQFQITSLMLSGFKSYEEPTELVFGNPTVITGRNGRGEKQHCRRHRLCRYRLSILWRAWN